MSFEFIYKYIIIGDSGVGKSCILMQFTKNSFDLNKENTVGVEFGNKIIDVDGTIVKLQVWDTAGQERFKSLIPSYLKDAHMALVVFDLASTPRPTQKTSASRTSPSRSRSRSTTVWAAATSASGATWV